jgi:hypothetical protein
MATDRTLEELYGVADSPRSGFTIPTEPRRAKGKPVKPSQADPGAMTLEARARQRQDEQRDAARRGLGAPEEQGPSLPPAVADREAGRFANEDRNRVLLGNPAIAAAMEASRGSTVRVKRPTYGAEQDYFRTVGGSSRVNELTGERERVAGTQERQYAAQVEQMDEAEVQAQVQAQLAAEAETVMGAADDAMVANQRRRMQHQADQIEGVRKQQEGITRAADAMEASPDLGTWWQSRTSGQKAAAVVSAVLLGLVGRDPMAAINASIAEEQEIAKANFGKKASVLAARGQEMAASQNVYTLMADHADSEQELDLMARSAYLENLSRKADRMMAEGATRMLPAKHQELKAALEEEIAKAKLQLEYMRAKSTPTRSVRVPAYSGMVRKAIGKEGAEQADFGRAVQMEGVKSGYKQREEAAKGGDLGDKHIETDTRYNSAKAGIGLIDEMLKLSDQAGGGEPGRFGPFRTGGLLGDADPLVSPEAEGFRQMQTSLEGILQEAYGGASPTPAQVEAAKKDTGQDAGSGGMSRRALERTRARLTRQLEDAERKLSEGHRRHRARNENLPEADTEWTSGSMPDSYEPE